MVWMVNVFVVIFGACIGSFLNCLAWRLYHNEGLWGRSKCPKCHQSIAWYDNIPLLSYLALGGQCRHCRQKIAIQYFLMELAVAGLFLLAFSRHFSGNEVNLLSTLYPVKSSFAGIPFLAELFHGVNFVTFNSQSLWLIIRDWLLISFLTVVFIMDLRWMVVADEITLPAIVVIGALNIYLGWSWSSLLSSAIIGAGFFALQYALSRGRWVGGGDIRIGALMGMALGWPLTLVALMLAYFSGALAGVILIILKKKGLKSPLPFGVFLAPATLAALWWGQALWQWYANLLF